MDVFNLSDAVIRDYEAFSRSFVNIRSSEIQQKVDREYGGRRFWPDPLLQINPYYKAGGSLSQLVGSPGLHPETATLFRAPNLPEHDHDPSMRLYAHQAQAIQKSLEGRSFVVTTGTGSGKSLCFFIPIADAILKDKKENEKPHTRAAIIYPMNALANSQVAELRRYIGQDGPIRFARYTGQESLSERERIRKFPPDILLTNFMMLELLMTRQDALDKQVLANCSGLQFIVLDELHTYRGRQGADVAMLMRRLKARVCNPDRPPIAIGTSATMSSAEDEKARNRAVADVASRMFGTGIDADDVITETLRRATDETRSASTGLPGLDEAVRTAARPGAYNDRSNSELAHDPLAIWVETALGLKNVELKPERARPVSLERAVVKLANASGVDEETCSRALRNALLAYSQPESARVSGSSNDQPLFAFRLHQLVSGAGRLYATLDAPGQRSVTFDGQVFDPEHPSKLLFATHFCRNCGQEHHPVFLIEKDGKLRFEKREIDDLPLDTDDDDLGGRRWGFLMPEPVDGEFNFGGAPEDYPEAWQEVTRRGDVRLKANFRKSAATLHSVAPDGGVDAGGVRAWFMPGKFKFCPACGDFHTDSTRDINRLSSLTAEGRSSATTVLVNSVLRWMHAEGRDQLEDDKRKLLAFTDNRQDAALQAGHFNDFIFVTLLRGSILAALQQSCDEGLTHDKVGRSLQRALDFVADNVSRRAEWMVDPTVKGARLMDAEKAIREGLAHRFWIDQRRGWRFTNPNLEQLGLLDVEYRYLDAMCADEAEFSGVDALEKASVDERKAAARELFDHLRKGIAVEVDALDRLQVEALAGRMRNTIRPPWSVSEDRMRGATALVLDPPRRAELTLADEAYLLRGGPRSRLGRALRRLRFGGSAPEPKEVGPIIEGLVQAGRSYGLVSACSSPVGDGEGYRLNPDVIVFHARGSEGPSERPNAFFSELYRTVASMLLAGGEALFGFESREHTAQVDQELRRAREARFRYSEDDQTELKENEAELKEAGEDISRLPTLFCSPTMELGVDISSMNVVYLRNMPPTPANYVQRSGRAGRSGQAALILSYCAAQSPHDKYFFKNPEAMVAGVVKAPTIDLANKDLVDSHLHAEWLAASGLAGLDPNIPSNLEMTVASKPLVRTVKAVVEAPETAKNGAAVARPILDSLQADLAGAPWFTGVDDYAESVGRSAPRHFDQAFDRWRELFASAELQRDDAERILKDYSIPEHQRRSAEARLAQAHGQIKLLLGGSANIGSDFYIYRYLATEGFLPGYNFPRLPLMAFIPGNQDKTKDRFLQRARFLAIAEFGPGSLVYHEGRAYRVDRALLGAGTADDGRLATFATWICPACGAGHDEEDRETCHLCGHPLANAHVTRDLFRVDNVGTRPAERITANDEERRRQGFDLQTTVEMPTEASRTDVALLSKAGDPLALATFAPAARIRRINRGLRRRRDNSEVGFLINPRTGRWLGKSAGETTDASPTDQPQRITPVVEDRKNALMIRFPAHLPDNLDVRDDSAMVTLQHALARGIEAAYQLEEGEILAEPTPGRSHRKAILFYESAEGGAGALGRLVGDGSQFRTVAREALRTIHLTDESIDRAAAEGISALEDAADTRCVVGCYRCLLSYYNQPDHPQIDRTLGSVRAFLLHLLNADFDVDGGRHEDAGGPGPGGSASTGGPPTPDPKPVRVGETEITMVWRRHRLAAVEADTAAQELIEELADKGLDVVVLPSSGAEREAVWRDLAQRLRG